MREVPAMVRGEPIALQPARALTAWLPDDEALTALFGRAPLASDDLSAPGSRIAQARAALAARPPFEPESPLVTPAERADLDALAARADIAASFGALDWRPEIVDLSRVQAVQKVIGIAGLDERVALVAGGGCSLSEFCLPAQVPEPPVGALTDAGQRGFAVSSLNPNLRIVGTDMSSAELVSPTGPLKVQVISFFVNFGNSYLNLASCDGRYFLRDGYHRAAALLRAGIKQVPCVVVGMDGGFEHMMPSSQTFPRSICFGPRPPLLSDFFDAAVSDEVTRPSTRKVVRVRGEEFFVPG